MQKHEKDAGGKLALTECMVPGDEDEIGTSNYYVPVYGSARGGNPEIAMLLYFFDSRGGRLFDKTGADGKDVPQGGWVADEVLFKAVRGQEHH